MEIKFIQISTWIYINQIHNKLELKFIDINIRLDMNRLVIYVYQMFIKEKTISLPINSSTNKDPEDLFKILQLKVKKLSKKWNSNSLQHYPTPLLCSSISSTFPS